MRAFGRCLPSSRKLCARWVLGISVCGCYFFLCCLPVPQDVQARETGKLWFSTQNRNRNRDTRFQLVKFCWENRNREQILRCAALPFLGAAELCLRRRLFGKFLPPPVTRKPHHRGQVLSPSRSRAPPTPEGSLRLAPPLLLRATPFWERRDGSKCRVLSVSVGQWERTKWKRGSGVSLFLLLNERELSGERVESWGGQY